LREAPVVTNDARLDVPATVVCTGLSSEQIKGAVAGIIGRVAKANASGSQ
jgi:hypothetical protein